MDWLYWRPVHRGLAPSLHEVKYDWTVIELLEAHESLDVMAEIEIMANKEQTKDLTKSRR